MYIVLSVLILAFLAWRTWADNKEYRRFKQVKTTAERQWYYRKWTVGSFVMLGGLSAGVLVVTHGHGYSLVSHMEQLRHSSVFESLSAGADSASVGFVFALLAGVAVGVVLRRKKAK